MWDCGSLFAFNHLILQGFKLMCERTDVLYGKVVQLHILRADQCPLPDVPLSQLARMRLKFRDNPDTIPNLSSYVKYRKALWIVEETDDGQFRCDCPVGHKGKVCKHELALNYKYGRIEVLPHAAALRLGAKRAKGRPKTITMERPKETFSAISSTVLIEGEESTPVGQDGLAEVEDGEVADLDMDEEPLQGGPLVQPAVHPGVEDQPEQVGHQVRQLQVQAEEQTEVQGGQPQVEDVQFQVHGGQVEDVQLQVQGGQPPVEEVQLQVQGVQPSVEDVQLHVQGGQPQVEDEQNPVDQLDHLMNLLQEEVVIIGAEETLSVDEDQAEPQQSLETAAMGAKCGCTGCASSKCGVCSGCQRGSKKCYLKLCCMPPTVLASPKGLRRAAKPASPKKIRESPRAVEAPKRKRVSPATSANTSVVVKPSRRRPRVAPPSPPSSTVMTQTSVAMAPPITTRLTRYLDLL